MAKRKRKSLRGTPAEHAKNAGMQATIMKRHLRSVSAALADGQCVKALRHLTLANAEGGGYFSEREHSDRKFKRNASPVYGRVLNNLENKFAKKCLRRSR